MGGLGVRPNRVPKLHCLGTSPVHKRNGRKLARTVHDPYRVDIDPYWNRVLIGIGNVMAIQTQIENTVAVRTRNGVQLLNWWPDRNFPGRRCY